MKRALWLLAVVLLTLASQQHWQRDLTQNAANSLSASSIEILRQLPEPVRITVYAAEQEADQADLRSLIRDFVALYQRYKNNLQLSFVDPAKQPEAARQAGVQSNGELVVEYDGRREKLSSLNEQSLSSALLRLAHRKEQLLMYVEGHGERKLEGIANHDLGEFGQRLQQNGFRLASLNLTLAQAVPDNASLLILTQPRSDWLPGEVEKVQAYLAAGGNLLWLLDNEPLHGLEPLAEQLGLVLNPGLVIDPAAKEQRLPENWALTSAYPPHAVSREFNLLTVFPFARPLVWEDRDDWRHSVLVEAAPRGWVTPNPPTGKTAAKFDPAHDTAGPVVLALALDRTVNDKAQRVIAVGSGSFLANTFSGNGGNLAFGVNLVNWLSSEERLIAAPLTTLHDDTLNLSRNQLIGLSLCWLVLLPLILLAAGIRQWRRRRA